MRTSIVLAAVGALLVVGAGPALAETSLSVAAPSQAEVGSTVPVTITVTEDGEPVSGAMVTLSRRSTFGGVTGYAELVHATTGDDGTADLSYIQRAAVESSELRIEVVDSDVEPLDFVVTTVGVPEQIHRPSFGVDIGPLGGWVLIVLIAGLWAVILSTVVRLRTVAIAGGDSGESGKRTRRLIPFVVPGIVAVIASVLVTVLVRNPATHANLDGPGEADRVPLSFIGEVVPILRPGLAPQFAEPTGDPVLDGSRAFIGLGCSSCHGLDGVSGVVGGNIMSEIDEGVDEFLKSVRRGPKGMPAYPEDAFSDEELAAVHAYLESRLGD